MLCEDIPAAGASGGSAGAVPFEDTSARDHIWKGMTSIWHGYSLGLLSIHVPELLVQNPPKPVLVSDFLKDTDPRGHAWKYMAMGPDGWLYIAVGSPCDK